MFVHFLQNYVEKKNVFFLNTLFYKLYVACTKTFLTENNCFYRKQTYLKNMSWLKTFSSTENVCGTGINICPF